MNELQIPYLKKHEEKFNLKHQVKYFQNENEDTLRCSIQLDNFKNRFYKILGPEYLFSQNEIYNPIHELSHCEMSKKFDPLFISTYFKEEEHSKENIDKWQKLWLSTRMEDIWIDENIVEKSSDFESIVFNQIETTFKQIKFIIENLGFEYLNDPIFQTNLAMNIAQKNRFGLKNFDKYEKPLLKKINKNSVGKKNIDSIKKLSEIGKNLPNINGEKNLETALKGYEFLANNTSKALGLGVKGKIIKSGKNDVPNVWEVRT